MADEVDDELDEEGEEWRPMLSEVKGQLSELQKQQEAESQRSTEFQTRIESQLADHRAETERLLKERPQSTLESSPPDPTPQPPEPEEKPKPSESVKPETLESESRPNGDPKPKFQKVVRRRRSI